MLAWAGRSQRGRLGARRGGVLKGDGSTQGEAQGARAEASRERKKSGLQLVASVVGDESLNRDKCNHLPRSVVLSIP